MPAKTKNIGFTEDQLLTLRAVWQYFLEDEEGMANIAGALGYDDEARGLDENGDYEKEDGESKDPLVRVVNEIGLLVMTD